MLRTNAVTWLLLGLVIWLSHFLQIRSFGFYEDDYSLVAPFITAPTGEDVALMWRRFTMTAQGRPVGFFAAVLFSRVGYELGGVAGIYALAFLLIWFNAVMLHRLVGHCLPEYPRAAIVAALVYALYPADTTKILLTHSLILQVSVAFLLAACLLYLHRRYFFSYLVICGSLLSYESGFITFLAAPLLSGSGVDRSWRNLLRHMVVMGCILAVAAVLRSLSREARIAELSLVKAASLASLSFVIGPAMNVMLFFRAVSVSVWEYSGFLLPLACFLLTGAMLALCPEKNNDSDLSGRTQLLSNSGQWREIDVKLTKLLVAGLAMLGASYLLSFTHFPPTAAVGRMTSVHLCASVAGALTAASCWQIMYNACRNYWQRWLTLTLLVVSFALLAGYHGNIQSDFAASWRYQKSFWRQVTTLCPDLSDGTVIWVKRGSLPQTTYIQTNSWADLIVLRKIYRFPAEWKHPPRLVMVDKLEELVRVGKNGLVWDVPAAYWAPHSEAVPHGNVILLEARGERLQRVNSNPAVQGSEIVLKPLAPDLQTHFPRTAAYTCLIESELQ